MVEEILLIDKPKDISSAQVVNLLKSAFPGEKIGHGGTLDPAASGLLIILVGKATKLFSQLQNLPKTYLAEITFGQTTTTLDQEGEITKSVPPQELHSRITLTTIKETLSEFPRSYSQVVPEYAAAKFKGKPLYWWKRKYPSFSLPVKRKKVTIYNLQLLDLNLKPKFPRLKIKLSVSSGFYVRQFAFDLGKKLEVPAYLSNLRRLSIGEYELGD